MLAPFDGGTIYVADAIRAPLYSLTGGALYRIRVEEGAGEARATFVVDRFALDDLELRMIAAFSSSDAGAATAERLGARAHRNGDAPP